MPYVVTQGNINTALENAFNLGHTNAAGVYRPPWVVKLETLRDLRNGSRVGDAGGILSGVVSDHIDEHWFGVGGVAGGPTGWWMNWRGPAEDIARQGIITALEVALGLKRDEDPALYLDPDPRPLPPANHRLDFTWICPVPRFEMWVSWRDMGQVVQVVMATPGYTDFGPPGAAEDPDGVIKPYEPLETVLDPNYIAPGDPYAPNGHIVVGTAETAVEEYVVELGEGDNAWKLVIGLGANSDGQAVVTHRPEIWDGIADDGRPENGVTQ